MNFVPIFTTLQKISRNEALKRCKHKVAQHTEHSLVLCAVHLRAMHTAQWNEFLAKNAFNWNAISVGTMNGPFAGNTWPKQGDGVNVKLSPPLLVVVNLSMGPRIVRDAQTTLKVAHIIGTCIWFKLFIQGCKYPFDFFTAPALLSLLVYLAVNNVTFVNILWVFIRAGVGGLHCLQRAFVLSGEGVLNV